MKQVIRDQALDLGFDDCRFTSADPPTRAKQFQSWLQEGQHGEMAWLARNAEKRIDPQRLLPGARSILCLAASYHPGPSCAPAAPAAGMVARYAQYEDYHDVLGGKLAALTAFLESLAPETRSLWYTDTGPVRERDIAQRAGLGFAGKHTNLISKTLGNWFFIAEIITTLELEPDQPETNRCGTCTRCITACPTRAITAPFILDARQCISYLTIELKGPIPVDLRPLIGNRIYGCDDCLAACPWNRFAREGRLMRPHFQPGMAELDLMELLSLDNAQFRTRFARSPLLRTKRRGLLRNVCVALGNTGTHASLPALEKAGLDPEPLVAEHAIWAAKRIRARQPD